MAKNRWELEENRKKKALEAALAAIKNENPAQMFNRVQGQINSALQQQSSSRGSGGFSGGSGSSSGSSSGKSSGTNFVSSGRSHGKTSGSSGGTTQRTNTTTTPPASQQQSSFGLQGLQNLPIFGAGNVSSAGSSLHRVGSTTREDYLAGGAARRRTNIDSRTGTNTSRGAQREEDEKNLQLNQARWHLTTDQAERDRLHQANNEIRARLGLAYDNGTTYDPRTGRNYSLPTDLLFSGTAAQRARLASQYPLSREAHGLDWDTPSIYPSMQQIVEAGSAEAARGTSAREALQDLYTRSEETWTEQDTKTRDRAVEALEDEMSEILSRYGLHYRRGLLDMGGWSEETATDATATDLLRRAGANEQTIRYVENNIEQRQAADRLGQGVEAVVKRAVGSIPALFETAQQQSENVEQSRQNPEYVQLEAEEQQLENQLTGMPSTNYDGTLNQEYMDVYNRLQQVRERKGQLAVQTPVDQSKWGQTMLREAAEAQANATAGLSRVPRLLANTGISIAGNAPGMAASLIPGFGPAIGAGLMATQAAGQRAQELSARGVSPSEALGRGVVSGLIEAVTEKLPIDHLSNILHSGGIVAVRNFLRQMGIEATEESASYVMNFAADWAANDPDAQFSFAELVDQALGGALSGGFYATVGTVGGKALAGPQAAQTDVQQGQAGQRPFWQAEPVRGDFAANETGPANTEPVRAGRVTTIQSPYTGKTPVNTSPQTQGQTLTIGADALDSARQAITASQQSGTFARTIKSVLQSVFQQQGGPRSVTVQGVTFDGQPYEVALNRNAVAKIASDPNMSAEKIAAFNNLDNAVATAEYVGSGHYNKRKSKSEKVIRYDYFEKPLEINGQDYVMSFDVEVYPGTNNFRTYKVINQIDLMPVTAIRRSTTGGHITMQSGLSDNSISQTDGNINPAEGNSQAIGQTYTGLDDFAAPLTQTLVKIDEQMRIAENLPAGPARENRIQALQEGAQDVSRQLAAIENNRTEFMRAQTIAERFGAKFALADLGAAGGKYENGTITINPYSSSPVRQVLVHELTHHLETSGQYDALQRQALRMFAAEQGVDVDTLRANITQMYAQNGVQLDADGADRELTAAFCENRLFRDEASIQRLAQADQGLFERIRQWIADAVARLRGTPEQREMLRLQQMYERAARTAGQREGYRGAQYSIDERSTLAAQRAYREAVERGDTQTAEEILRQRYQTKGYSPNIDNRMMHAAPNSRDGYSVRFDDLSPMYGDDIYSPYAENYFGTGESYDGAAIAAIQNAQNNPNGLVTVYRAIPSGSPDSVLRNGDWVTTVEDYARKHGERTLEGAFRIIEETVPARNLYGNGDSILEFGYDNGNDEVYRSAAGNAKTAGITYDDYGHLIPLSQRFDESNPDRRYTFGFSPEQIAAAPAASVPVTEAIQYGKTPEQAMQEAAVRAQGEARQAAAQSERAETVSNLLQAWQDKRAAEKQAEQTREGLTLTDNDIRLAQNAAASGVDTVNWEYADNPEKAMLYGKTLRAVREADQPIRQYFAQRAAALQSEAQSAADAIATFAKDKRTGFSYQRETMERNIRDIFGKEHQAEAEAIIREYITPVHEAVAEGNRLKNSMRERVKALKLNKHERALVQMRLEAEDGAAAEYIENNKIKVTPKMDAKIDRAVQEFRSIYNELYNQINQTLLLNGQEPAPFRQNYAPHFVKDKPDTLLGRVRFALGLGKDSNLNVPTDIAGLTDTFRPGKKWFGNLLQREGEITDYDAVAGFDQYIETAADVITLTESIQKLRALEDQVRYTLSDEGVKARIDAIRADPELDALQQRQKIEEVYDDNRSSAQQLIDDLRNQKRMGMGRFVTELRRYTDNLAGKKSREDRGWEDMVNRQFYTVAKNLEGRVAANMISLNPGSWLTNVIPITQATGEVSVPNLVRGMFQTVRAHGKDDGYRDASAFLTNRYGSERLDRSIGRRVSDLSGAPMELIDHFTANTIHRAKYAQNIDQGMSMDEAIADADAYTAGLMADRSKGALPTVFNATNPIRKVFTMFQVEVNNQLSYLFKDMPKAQREKGVAAVAWAYTKVFTTAYLFNLAYSQLTGRDSAFDPIGIIADALGVGEEDDEERTVSERLATLAEDVGGNIPFIGGVLFDGGRVPISSALPDFANLAKAAFPDAFGVEWTPEKRAQTAMKELAAPLTYLVPRFGGGAIRRMVEGYATVDAGGSYTYDNDGNRTLQFPVYGMDPLDYAQAMIFGKWSSEEAQEYINSGFKGLSAKETAAFDKLRREMGVDGHDAMEAVLSLRGFESVKDAEGNTQLGVKEQQRLALFDNDKLTPEQKAAIDQILLVSGEDELPADYTDRNAFLLGQYVSESRQDAAREAISHGLDIDQFVSWDDRLRELQNEKDANDERVRTDAAGLEMALDEVMQDSALSDSEKQAIADYVLISSMSDKQREDWETGGRGNVNASDFVRWTSRVSQLENEKGADDKQVRTAAEARNMVLDELAAAAIDDETRQKIAEYVIIPTMGEADAKKREDWANIAKGHVNATDFIRFQDDLTIYKDWAKGSETDNARNVAEILRGYDGISDEQRDILFQTYTETMASNPFHVSSYEQQIADNQFYQDLSEEGRLALRALTNEYEQAVNEGKELDSWLAKAYMANAEANITPGVYALYRVALQAVNAQVDNNGNYSPAEAQAAVESLPDLSQHQKAYLWQSTNKSWKNNPYGSATVGEYSSGMEVGINPIAGGVVTSFFGPRKSFQTDNGAWASSLHPSIDIGAAEGTPIGAYKSGTVIQNGWVSGYGWTIEVEHSDGTVSAYHHMMQQSPVAVGTAVSQGQQIGQVGQTGNSKGPHLDLTIMRDGTPIDPATLIPELEGSASGYIYEGTVSSGAVSSGAATARAEKASSGGSSGSSGLKKLEGLSGLKSLF